MEKIKTIEVSEKRRKRLVEEYISFFTEDVHKPVRFGFSCGDGWLDLIEDFLSGVKQIGEPIYISTIKEKFGHLNIYFSGGGQEIFNLARNIEKDSHNVCEICGTRHLIGYTYPWLKTICYPCYIEWNKGIRKLDNWKPKDKKEYITHMREKKLKRILDEHICW